MAGRSCQGVAIGDERSGNQDSSREATKFSGKHLLTSLYNWSSSFDCCDFLEGTVWHNKGKFTL